MRPLPSALIDAVSVRSMSPSARLSCFATRFWPKRRPCPGRVADRGFEHRGDSPGREGRIGRQGRLRQQRGCVDHQRTFGRGVGGLGAEPGFAGHTERREHRRALLHLKAVHVEDDGVFSFRRRQVGRRSTLDHRFAVSETVTPRRNQFRRAGREIFGRAHRDSRIAPAGVPTSFDLATRVPPTRAGFRPANPRLAVVAAAKLDAFRSTRRLLQFHGGKQCARAITVAPPWPVERCLLRAVLRLPISPSACRDRTTRTASAA